MAPIKRPVAMPPDDSSEVELEGSSRSQPYSVGQIPSRSHPPAPRSAGLPVLLNRISEDEPMERHPVAKTAAVMAMRRTMRLRTRRAPLRSYEKSISKGTRIRLPTAEF